MSGPRQHEQNLFDRCLALAGTGRHRPAPGHFAEALQPARTGRQPSATGCCLSGSQPRPIPNRRKPPEEPARRPTGIGALNFALATCTPGEPLYYRRRNRSFQCGRRRWRQPDYLFNPAVSLDHCASCAWPASIPHGPRSGPAPGSLRPGRRVEGAWANPSLEQAR